MTIWAAISIQSSSDMMIGLLESGKLTDQQAETRMDDFKQKSETAVAGFAMDDGERARRGPCRQKQAKACDIDEVAVAAEGEGAAFDRDTQRHADAKANMLFEAGRPGKTLAGMHNVRKSAFAGVEPRPDLS